MLLARRASRSGSVAVQRAAPRALRLASSSAAAGMAVSPQDVQLATFALG
jgi:hypothetical protein